MAKLGCSRPSSSAGEFRGLRFAGDLSKPASHVVCLASFAVFLFSRAQTVRYYAILYDTIIIGSSIPKVVLFRDFEGAVE